MYKNIFTHFKADKKSIQLPENKHLLVWGCSATLRRHDGQSLGVAFDEIVYEKKLYDMVKDKW